MPSLPSNIRVEVTVDAETPIPTGVSELSIRSLAEHTLAAEGATGSWQLGIRFVDDETMQRAHVDFMGIDEPTDIMTFPYEGEDFAFPGGKAEVVRGGDLLISAERADEHAAEAGWDVSQELLFLVCHGLLHLLGWDDASDEARGAMLRRQDELMQSWQEAAGA